MDDLLITLQNRIRDGTISLEDAYQLTAPTGKPVGFTPQIITLLMEKEKVLQGYKFPKKKSTDGYYHIAIKDVTKCRRKAPAFRHGECQRY